MIPAFPRTVDGYFVGELFLEPNDDVDAPTINGDLYRVFDQQAYGRTTASPTVSFDSIEDLELRGDDGVPLDVIEVPPEPVEVLGVSNPPVQAQVCIPTVDLAYEQRMREYDDGSPPNR